MSDPWKNYCSAWNWYLEADSLLDWWVENGNPERSCAHSELIDTIEFANDEQERAYEAYQSTRTVQAAPSDRERKMVAALKAYSLFEAALVTDRGSWSGPTGHPFRTNKLLDQFMECQRLRNAALAAAPDKPQGE